MIGKILSGIAGGVIISILGMTVVGLSTGGGEEGGEIAASSFIIFMLYSLFIAIRSASVARAWKWLMISSSVLCFLLPISSLLFTGIFIAKETSGAAEAAGGVIGGGLLTTITGTLGFFLGAIFLVIGLVVGNDKGNNQKS